MSNLSAALAAALQNDSDIAAQISGVIAGRNFTIQDQMLTTLPYACLALRDLPRHERFFLSSGGTTSGQIEIRCISVISEQKAKDLAEDVKTYLRAASTLPWDGGHLAFGLTGMRQDPDVSEDLSTWHEIITIDYVAIA